MNSQQASGLALARSRDLSRPLLFGGLVAIGLANGMSENISAALDEGGIFSAVLNTFDISVFVWLAMSAGLLLVAHSPSTRPDRADWALVAATGVAILVPVPALSWLAVTALALILLARSAPGSTLWRGASILLAVTIPMFWARIVMSLFNDAILTADATLTALAVGSQRVGNMVPFADGSGAMWIAPGCSSFTNLSLAILAFVTLVNVTSGKWSPATLGLGVLTCVLVVIVNVTRISLIGYYPDQFNLIHGPVGASIANWLTTLLIMAVGWYTVRHDALTLG